MSEGSSSTPSRKDSNSKKASRFRISTLFPQATFVQQLGLDKLNARATIPQDTRSPHLRDADVTLPDRSKRKATEIKNQDYTALQNPATSSPEKHDDTTKLPPPNANEGATTTPSNSKPATTNTPATSEPNKNNHNGKRHRLNTADPPGVEIPARPPVSTSNTRSNTVIPPIKTPGEPVVKAVEPPAQPNNSASVAKVQLNSSGKHFIFCTSIFIH
jgi:hypothetical protein